MLYRDEARAILARIKESKSVAIIGHPHPDPDLIGSQFAVAAWCRRHGVTPAMHLLGSYKLLPVFGAPFEPTVGPPPDEPVDTLFILDVGNLKRARENGPIVSRARFVINIDHHPDNEKFGQVAVVDSAASSVGELMFLLLTAAEEPIDAELARYLYIAILTDTGGFKYTNTTPRAATILAELLKFPIQFTALYRELYDLLTLAQLRLRGRMIERLEPDFEGRLVEAVLFEKDLVDLGLEENEASHLVSELTNIRGVEVAALYRQFEPGRVGISFRSTTAFDVKKLANELGGGGHIKASGATFEGTLEEARARVRRYLAQNLEQNRDRSTSI